MVADRFSNIAALLCKLETEEGTDATPSGAANAIQCANFNFTPVTGQDEEKDLVTGWLGDTGVWLEGNYAQIEFRRFPCRLGYRRHTARLFALAAGERLERGGGVGDLCHLHADLHRLRLRFDLLVRRRGAPHPARRAGHLHPQPDAAEKCRV